MSKREIIEQIRKEVEASRGTYIWSDYVNSLKLISQVVFTRGSGFVFELIQNAEDARMGLTGLGEFEIRINESRVKITHNGEPFDENDVKAICGIRSSKKPEKGTLGYLGIGFKSVFKATDRPEIYSNGFQFKFDRDAWSEPSNTPWHVIPIWIDEPSESFDTTLTTFVIPFREKGYHSRLLEEMKNLKTELYLFLRGLKTITIVDEITGKSWLLEDTGNAEDGITTLKSGEDLQRFKIFRRVVDVPEWVKQDRLTQEYRPNVRQREITIAFALDKDGDLSPYSAGAMYGGVYSFLPLGEAKSGAHFPIQADFLVQPGRDAVNYESPWNHWLLEQVTDLCKEAIGYFKEHPKWKYQFLQTFDFTKSPGHESYEKLFGPHLIDPLETFLLEDASIPTADGGWAKPDQVVWLKEDTDAVQDLIAMGLFAQDEIAPAFGERSGLVLAHPEIKWHRSGLIKEVGRWDILNNEDLLKEKSQGEKSADWFRVLYLWLAKHPVYESYRPKYARNQRRRIKGYHDIEFILTADSRLLKGGTAALLDIDTSEAIRDLAQSWQMSKGVALLHPELLASAKDDEERNRLRGFLTGLTGVQVANSKDVCKEIILPLILTRSTDRPSSVELVKHMVFCQRILGKEFERGSELWVLTKQGDIRTAKEVYFSSEFKPEQDWERYQCYLPGLSFISTDYLTEATRDEDLLAWREFFKTGGVRESPDNGVEDFAVNYAVGKLRASYKNVTVVEKRKHGWDIEAENESGDKVTFEVKGQSTDHDVELKDNEADAADKYGDSFYLCVVSSIPNNPLMHLVRDPARVGKKDKITIPIAVWKGYKVD